LPKASSRRSLGILLTSFAVPSGHRGMCNLDTPTQTGPKLTLATSERAIAKLPLRTYLAAIAIFCNEVKGKSALAISRDLGVSYKACFVILHKLREAMAGEIDLLPLNALDFKLGCARCEALLILPSPEIRVFRLFRTRRAACLAAIQERYRRLISDRAIWPDLVIVSAPRLKLLPCIVQRQESMRVEAFLPEPSVEGLDERVIGGLTRPREVERDAFLISPEIKVARDELRALVNANGLRIANGAANPLECGHHVLTPVAEARIKNRREACERVNHGQEPDLPARRQLIVNKVHGPHLLRTATGIPSSPCLMMNAFCASENFDAFIAPNPVQPQKTSRENSNQKRGSFWGADHHAWKAGYG